MRSIRQRSLRKFKKLYTKQARYVRAGTNGGGGCVTQEGTTVRGRGRGAAGSTWTHGPSRRGQACH